MPFQKELLITGGLVWLLCSILVYQFTGALSLLEEISLNQRALGTVLFMSISLLCFWFAWRAHVAERYQRIRLQDAEEWLTKADRQLYNKTH